MKFSFWTQILNYSEIVSGNKDNIIEDLLEYYKKSSKSFALINKKDSNFKFSRGSKWISALALGSEKWCYHTIEVTMRDINNSAEVTWNIDLKIFGFQVRKNAIVEECKGLIKNNILG